MKVPMTVFKNSLVLITVFIMIMNLCVPAFATDAAAENVPAVLLSEEQSGEADPAAEAEGQDVSDTPAEQPDEDESEEQPGGETEEKADEEGDETEEQPGGESTADDGDEQVADATQDEEQPAVEEPAEQPAKQPSGGDDGQSGESSGIINEILPTTPVDSGEGEPDDIINEVLPTTPVDSGEGETGGVSDSGGQTITDSGEGGAYLTVDSGELRPVVDSGAGGIRPAAGRPVVDSGEGGYLPADPEDVFSVLLPTDENFSAGFDFILDPHMLIARTGGARFGPGVHIQDNSLYFANHDAGGGVVGYSGSSDELEITNRSTVDVEVTVRASMAPGGNVLMAADRDFAGNTPQIYMALTDGEATAAITDAGAVLTAVIPAAALDAYTVSDSGSYELTEEAMEPGYDGFSVYRFKLTGACNQNGDWSRLMDVNPVVSVEWTVRPCGVAEDEQAEDGIQQPGGENGEGTEPAEPSEGGQAV